jgi:hypothetical protein
MKIMILRSIKLDDEDEPEIIKSLSANFSIFLVMQLLQTNKVAGRCYERGTQITMLDGTTKRADQVRIGEKLPCYGGKQLTINNIYTGKEKELIHIQTGNAQVKVSAGHIMLLESGTGITIEKLRVGDKIMLANQTLAEITSIEPIPYDDNVYNFSFDGEETGNYLIANGFYSGDFYAQNVLHKNLLSLTSEQERLYLELREIASQKK